MCSGLKGEDPQLRGVEDEAKEDDIEGLGAAYLQCQADIYIYIYFSNPLLSPPFFTKKEIFLKK